MAGKKAFEEKVARIGALRSAPVEQASIELRKALRDSSNFIAGKAAEVTGDLELQALAPDLAAAFEHFLDDAVKRDPQCWAKNAIAKALRAFEHQDGALFIRGVKHVQLEPSFGGSTDTAVALRGVCASALVQCRGVDDLTILGHLVDLLADSEKAARADAARAIEQLGKPEGALVLRTKLHGGDSEPEVMGACMAAIASLSQSEIPFVARYLDHANEDWCFEAAAALGESRTAAAFVALRDRFPRIRDRKLRRAVLVAIGATRQPEAVEFLLRVVAEETAASAADALLALTPFQFHEETRGRVEKAVADRGDGDVRTAFEREFGSR